MQILTVTENKIKLWEGVRDVPSLKLNLEAAYGIEVDCYIVKRELLVMDFEYTSFMVDEETNTIHFQIGEDGLEETYEEIGWPAMTDKEIVDNYTFAEVDQILKIRKKYDLEKCKVWDRLLNSNDPANITSEEMIPPDDYPDIPRKNLKVYLPTTIMKTIKRVKVEKHED
jgi:hypothetical protein